MNLMPSPFKGAAHRRWAVGLLTLASLVLLWSEHRALLRLERGETDERALEPASGGQTRTPHAHLAHGAPAKAQPAGSVPVDKAPFDVNAVVEKVRSSFETTDDAFRGGRAEYGVRASAEGIALKARRWQPESPSAAQSKASDKRSAAHHDHSPKQKPIESTELVLRTAHVGRSAAEASRARGDDNIPVLRDEAQLVVWERDNHTEHLRQTSQGVEQSWEFPAKPEGRDDLVVRVDVSGLKYVKETANGLHFADARGLGFRYGHGTWVDAAGVKTAVAAHYANGAIELSVPRDVVERSAYPAVLDPVVGPEFGFEPVVGARSFAQVEPSVASNGTDYLVVWSEWTGSNGPHIQAARVSAAGVVLDGLGLAVSVVERHKRKPTVASDGQDYLVVWQELRSDPDWGIHANRVTAAGDVLDGGGFQVAAATGSQTEPRVASNGEGYLVTWTDSRAGNADVYATRVTATGTVLDGDGFGVSAGSSDEGTPSVASNGTDYLVAWTDFRSGSDKDVYASRVSADGEVVDLSGIPIATGAYNQVAPAIAANGASYLIAWSNAHYGEIRASRVTADGQALELSQPIFSILDAYALVPSVASNGTDFLVAVSVWSEWEDMLFCDVYARRVGGAGAVLDDSPLVMGSAGGETAASVASNGSDYLIAWSRFDILASRVSDAGVVQPKFVVSMGTNAQVLPVVASNGRDFLVAWEDERNDEVGAVYASRVNAAGKVLDVAGLLIRKRRGDELEVASNGAGYLVVWTESLWDPYGDRARVFWRSVSASGKLGYEQSGDWGDAPRQPSVASNGSDYLVVWDGDNVTRVNETGEFIGSPLQLSNVSTRRSRVASNGKDYLVVWSQESDVFARRLTSKGTLQGAEFAVSTADGEQSDPDVTSNGSDYLVAWTDERSGVDSDVFASRVTASGVVQDASGFALSAAAGDQESPHLASNGRDYLALWADKRTGIWQTRGANLTLEPRAVSEFALDMRGSARAAGRGDRYLVAGTIEEQGVPKVALRFITEDCDLDPEGDDDGDAICGSTDNCPDIANFGQEDSDKDGRGDACDACEKVADEDSDGDGTADCVDQCPNDPGKATDFDLDADGALNCNDGCPTNPKKTNPGACGCNASDADMDVDGTPDCLDPCPSDEQDACVDPGEGGAGGADGSRPDVSHAADDSSDDGSGCGCRTAGGSAGSMSGILVLIAGIGFASRRRLRAA